MICRACKGDTLVPFVDLGVQPLSNDFRVSNYGQPQFPLNVLVCSDCHLGQLSEAIDPAEVFNDRYPYFSSASPTWVEDRRLLANRMINMFDLGQNSMVADIGCNDGYYLRHFKDHTGIVGWEPCANVAEAAAANGIPTVVDFWGPHHHAGNIDLANATNVLAHTPDILGFIAGVYKSLKPDGVATLEFPLFSNLIKYNQIDTIYHEHYSYISLRALSIVLLRNSMYMWRVEEVPTHGGSVRAFASRLGARFLIEDSVERAYAAEIDPTQVDMQYRASEVKQEAQAFFHGPGRVAGYGAPAKATVLCNYLGLGKDDIEFVVDDAPAKQGKLIPGTNIPVMPFAHLKETAIPEYIFVFPWNLVDPIRKKLCGFKQFGDDGGFFDPHIVTAIPSLVVTKI